jgi:hypothetical protein
VFAAELGRHASGRCSAVTHDPVLPLPRAEEMPFTDEDWL